MSKLIVSSVGIAGAGVGGLCIYQFSSSKEENKELTISISDLFKESQNKVLLTQSSDSGDWDKAWVKYKDANKDGTTDEWGVTGFESKKSEAHAFQEFKDSCTSKYSIKVKGAGDINYRRVSDWCTRPKKISELLASEKGLELIPESDSDQDWKASWGKYREAHKEEDGVNYKTSDTWTITNWEQDKTRDTLSSGFKSKCLEQAKQDVVTGKEDDLYKQVKDWCTRTKKIKG